MEVKILGYKKYDFTNDKGERVQGVSVYVSHFQDDVVGEIATKISITSPQLWQQLVDIAGVPGNIPGLSVLMHFNNKGKIVGLSAM